MSPSTLHMASAENFGDHSRPSAFTSYIAPSADKTLWDVIQIEVSPHDQQPGKIHVYQDLDSNDEIYKIGTTIRSVKIRMNEHKICCKSQNKHVYDSKRDIGNSYRLEALIKWDLGHYRMRRICSNRVLGHGEWFAVNKELAIKTVKQWENFMDHERPYDAQGNLKIIWRYLLKNRSLKAACVRKLGVKIRHRQWAAILASPTYTDYVYANLSHVGMESRRFRGWQSVSYWQLATVIFNLWVLALSRNVVVFYALVVVLGCAGSTRLPESQCHLNKSKK